MRGIKKEGKLILAFIILLVLLEFVSASDVQTLGKVKINDSILLKQNCVNVTYVNITSISVVGIQNAEMIPKQQNMTLVYNGYQTLLFSNNTLLGQYIVTGTCDENGDVKSWSYDYEVTPTGTIISSVQIVIYIFFLLICITITIFSSLLFHKNRMSKDTMDGKEMYELKKRNEVKFYGQLMKKKMWIVGLFGIYLSLLLFIAILGQLLYNIGLQDLFNITFNFVYIMAWGAIPFSIFWIAWLIISFWTSTVEIMRYQFGSIGGHQIKR